MSDNPYQSPKKPSDPPAKKPRGVGSCLVQIAVILGILVVLIAMLLPARRGAREAARRSSCTNHMATIAFGLENYVDEHGALPPAYTVDEDGKPLHSWRTLILPYMEMDYGALADKIDLTKPWNDPANKEARETAVPIYQCPSTDVPETHTVYLGVVVPGGCFQPGKPRRLSDITDSRDTLMVVEVDIEHSVHWMAPTDADEKWLASFGSGTMPHPGGFHTLGVNGSLRFETEDIEPARLRAMISIAGGD